METLRTVCLALLAAGLLHLSAVAHAQESDTSPDDKFVEYAKSLREEAKQHREFLEGLLRQVVYISTPIAVLAAAMIAGLHFKSRRDIETAVEKQFREGVEAHVGKRLSDLERRVRSEMDEILERMGERLEESERIAADFIQLRDATTKATSGKAPSTPKETKDGGESPLPDGGYYIAHQASKVRGEEAWYEIRIYIDVDVADEDEAEEAMGRIERVVYHLHESFSRPDIEMRNVEENFEKTVKVWGQFPIWAEVCLKDGTKQVLTRYLNF